MNQYFLHAHMLAPDLLINLNPNCFSLFSTPEKCDDPVGMAAIPLHHRPHRGTACTPFRLLWYLCWFGGGHLGLLTCIAGTPRSQGKSVL